jgi:hypothetical protein
VRRKLRREVRTIVVSQKWSAGRLDEERIRRRKGACQRR